MAAVKKEKVIKKESEKPVEIPASIEECIANPPVEKSSSLESDYQNHPKFAKFKTQGVK